MGSAEWRRNPRKEYWQRRPRSTMLWASAPTSRIEVRSQKSQSTHWEGIHGQER
jgi:hypothetical protein